MRLVAGFHRGGPGSNPGGGQSGAGASFIRVLRFSLPISIPPISPQSPSPIIRGWYNRPVMAAVPKVPPHELKKKPINMLYCTWFFLREHVFRMALRMVNELIFKSSSIRK
jgi:hypothetical protein